eukprot:5712041-Ditylum_brightwellii.AAC.1
MEEKEIMDEDDDMHVLKAWRSYINKMEEIMKNVILEVNTKFISFFEEMNNIHLNHSCVNSSLLVVA